LWQGVARNFVNAGGVPIPINNTLIKLLQTLIKVDQAKFLLIFRKRSLDIDQIKAKTDLDDIALEKMLNELMDNGILIGFPSSDTGIMVYNLVSILPGLIEFPFIRGEKGKKQKEAAKWMDKIFDELSHLTQSNYNVLVEQFKDGNPLDRVVPVNKEVEKCPIDAIELIDTLSTTNLDRCIGCGLSAHHCPEKARSLERTGLREVFIPPPQLAQNN